MDWIRIAHEVLTSYVAALRLRWSPDNARGGLVDQDEQGGVVSYGMLQTARRAPFQWAALGMVAALLLAACSRVDTARWTEEVKSWDGRVFQLEGYAEQDKSGWPLSHRGTTRFIEYYHRESGAYWKQEYGYHPMVFDIVDRRPVVLLRANSDGQCYRYGYPPLGLIAFRWSGIGWEQIPLDGLPINEMAFNVLEGIFRREDAVRDAKGLVTLAEKRQRDLGEIRLTQWIEQSGKRCAKVKEQGLKVDAPPPPVLTGSHGRPNGFKK